MKLTQTPEIVIWPKTHYIFIERIGPFAQTAPESWQSFHKILPEIAASCEIKSITSLYKFDPKQMIYRAGACLTAAPAKIPEGAKYEYFPGGKYLQFTLTGSYSNLPQASGRVFELIKEANYQRRDDFNIENYVNDPKTTPEDQLITQILIATI